MRTRLICSIIGFLLTPGLVAQPNRCEDAVLAHDISHVAAVAASDEFTWVSQKRDESAPWEVVRYGGGGNYEIRHQFHPTSSWFVSHLVPAGGEVFGIASRVDCVVPACDHPEGFLFRLRPGYLEALSSVSLPVDDLFAADSRLYWIEKQSSGTTSLMQYDLSSSSARVLLSGGTIASVEVVGDWVYFSRDEVVGRISLEAGTEETIFCCTDQFLVGESGEIYFPDSIPLEAGGSITIVRRFDSATWESAIFQRVLGENFGIAASWFEMLEERDGRLIGLHVNCNHFCQRTVAIATPAAWTFTGYRAESRHTTSVGDCRVDLYDPGPLAYAPGFESRLRRVAIDLPLVDSVDRARVAPGETVVLKGTGLDRINPSTIEIRDSTGIGKVSVVSQSAQEIVMRVWPRDRGYATLSLPAPEMVSVVVPLEVYWPRRKTITAH